MTPKLRLRRYAATILTGVVAFGGVIAGAGAASAGTTGGGGGGGDHGHFRTQIFKLEINSDTEATGGVVRAFGPVYGTGTDNQVSDNLDVFMFPKGNVNVWHETTRAGDVKVDFRSCTATYTEDGVWKLKGGTDKYRHARGFGKYSLFNFVVLMRLGHDGKASESATGHHHGRCDTNMNDKPKFFETTVIAIGKSSIGHHHHDD
jgi:hypothetical protein